MDKPKVVLFDIDYTLFNTDAFKQSQLKKHSVYGEVHDILKKLSKISKLVIFSEGEINFQKTKLDKTDLKKYFNEHDIHIFKNKTDGLQLVIKKYLDGQLFLVDDKLSILHDAKRLQSGVFTIWVKRGMYAENQKPIPEFKPDAEVENLKEIIPIVDGSKF